MLFKNKWMLFFQRRVLLLLVEKKNVSMLNVSREGREEKCSCFESERLAGFFSRNAKGIRGLLRLGPLFLLLSCS